MSDYTLNLSGQVIQKTELKTAFIDALAGMVNSPYFTGDEITQIYKDTLEQLKTELEDKSKKCGTALSKSTTKPNFLQENLPYPYDTDDLINLT